MIGWLSSKPSYPGCLKSNNHPLGAKQHRDRSTQGYKENNFNWVPLYSNRFDWWKERRGHRKSIQRRRPKKPTRAQFCKVFALLVQWWSCTVVMMAASLCLPQTAGNPPMDRFWSNAMAQYKNPSLSSPGLPQAKRARTSSMPALEPMFLPSMSSSILPPSIPPIISPMPHGMSSPTPSLPENFQVKS